MSLASPLQLRVRAAHEPPLRADLIASVFVLGFANGIAQQLYFRCVEDGIVPFIVSGFGISAVVWTAFYAVICMIPAGTERASSSDKIVCLLAGAALFLPSSYISWTVVTTFSLYVVRTSARDDRMKRAGIIMVGITVPMFWSRLIFSVFSSHILQADTILVSAVSGLKRVGNTIELPDANGLLVISSACSSVANLSLAGLCWVLFLQLWRLRLSPRTLGVGIGMGSVVVAINVARLSLIAILPGLYRPLHSPLAFVVVGWITTAAMVGICAVGLRREHAN